MAVKLTLNSKLSGKALNYAGMISVNFQVRRRRFVPTRKAVKVASISKACQIGTLSQYSRETFEFLSIDLRAWQINGSSDSMYNHK